MLITVFLINGCTTAQIQQVAPEKFKFSEDNKIIKIMMNNYTLFNVSEDTAVYYNSYKGQSNVIVFNRKFDRLTTGKDSLKKQPYEKIISLKDIKWILYEFERPEPVLTVTAVIGLALFVIMLIGLAISGIPETPQFNINFR